MSDACIKTVLYNLVQTQQFMDIKMHGGGLYGEVVFFELLKRLPSIRIIGFYDSNLYINPLVIQKCRENSVELLDINKCDVQKFAETQKIDVFYSPIFDGKFKDISAGRSVFTLHGFRGLELFTEIQSVHFSKNIRSRIRHFAERISFVKRMFFLRAYNMEKQHVLSGHSFVLDSEHTKASLKAFFPQFINAEIPVFYPPLQEQTENLPNIPFAEKSYFLLTSGARWEKNNLRAILAFDRLFSEHKELNFKVVLTGCSNIRVYEKRIKNRNKFEFLEYVERAVLDALHKNAYAFIYPSLNEGFGYPPLESMRYGVPVAASGTSSIPEVCRDAAIYFDPYNVNEIKNRIIQLLDKNIYEDYSKRGIERYKIVNERQRQDLEKLVNFILGESYDK